MSGKLTDGTKFTSSYPTSLQAPQFTRLLDQHDVQVTTQPAQTSIGSILLNLLPLAIILGLFLWTGRAARPQLASMVDSGPGLVPLIPAAVIEPAWAVVASAEWNSILAGLVIVLLAGSALLAGLRQGRPAAGGPEDQRHADAERR